MQNTKEIDFSTTAAKLRYCLVFTESRSEDVKVNDRMELLPSNSLNFWKKIIQRLIVS